MLIMSCTYLTRDHLSQSNEYISPSSARHSCSVKCCIRLTTCCVLIGRARCCSVLLSPALPSLMAIKNVRRIIKITHAQSSHGIVLS